MTARYFVDTNLLIYARDPQRDPAKHQRARQWMEQLWREHSGRLSIHGARPTRLLSKQ